MTDEMRVPERKLRHEEASHSGDGCASLAIDRRLFATGASIDNAARRIKRSADHPWPFKAQDVSPLAWWRTLPSDAFRDAEHLLLLATLERTAVLHGGDEFAAALAGDPAAAVGAAFSVMPIEAITPKTDIAMTALLRCALARHSAAALVLAQIIGLTNLDHGFATELSASWYTYGLRYSADPHKFGKAITTLLAAFRERANNGEIA
jgi:hypothetical protein